MRMVRRLLIALFVLGGLMTAVGMLALRWYRSPIAELTSETMIEIPTGLSLTGIGALLKSRGLVRYPALWAVLARGDGYGLKLRAGEYVLEPHTSPQGLARQFAEGRVVLHPVTLVEGWNCETVRQFIHTHEVLHPTGALASTSGIMAAVGVPAMGCEGEFFPDTYLVPRGTRDLDVLKLAHASMNAHLQAAWASRDHTVPLKTPYEALILASIVEKETAAPDERARIAGVFMNRLRRGMRLQTDPTVIYGMGSAYQGHIHTRDLQTDTPYNTYTRDGLPPTPIALPGAAAIKAVMQPAPTDSLYFVASPRADGHHIFSRTLAEHTAAVALYVASLKAMPTPSVTPAPRPATAPGPEAVTP